jgi:hypothetical protein
MAPSEQPERQGAAARQPAQERHDRVAAGQRLVEVERRDRHAKLGRSCRRARRARPRSRASSSTPPGILDLDAVDDRAEDGERHRQPVVVVCRRAERRAAGDGRTIETVVGLVDVDAGAAKLRREVAEPVALLPRMNPTPRMRVGVVANAATTATVGTRSEMSAMSTSMPRSSSGPRTVTDRRSVRPAAHLGEHVGERRVALQRVGPEPLDVTRPPVIAAIASG